MDILRGFQLLCCLGLAFPGSRDGVAVVIVYHGFSFAITETRLLCLPPSGGMGIMGPRVLKPGLGCCNDHVRGVVAEVSSSSG